MVNFRFHLISVVAIFLALSVGVALGSGFVGEALTKNLRKRIDNVRADAEALREENLDLRDRIGDSESFDLAVRPQLIGGVLSGEDVVVIRFDHTDGAVTDAVRSAIEEADATVASTITITDKSALASQEELEELAAIVGTTETGPGAVRGQMARRMGLMLGQAARQSGVNSDFGPHARAAELLDSLQSAGFVGVETETTDNPIPFEARFVIVGGGTERPNFNAWRLTIELSAGLIDEAAVVAVVETSGSDWKLVTRVREDDLVSGSLVTVDHADSTAGQIGLVLGLSQATQGVTGHYGSDDGATAPLPETSLD
jgi:hypothetical protein